MTTFYRLMLFALTLERQIARSTGRNPQNVAQLSREILDYELALFHHTHAANAAERN